MQDLWRCTLKRSTLHLPATRSRFHGLRAQQRSPATAYLHEPGFDYNLPFGSWDDPPPLQLEAMRTTTPVLLHTADPEATESDLAVAAARALFEGRSDTERERIGIIIYCHASTNENVAEGIACRIQYELGATTSMVFSLSQNLCSGLVALRLACALLQDEPKGRSAVIVAAEKWIHPFVRSFGKTAVFEDGSAALQLEAAGQPGWELGSVHHADLVGTPTPFEATPSELRQTLLQQGVRTLRETLDIAAVRPQDLDFALMPHIDGQLCDQILQGAGMEHVYRPRDMRRQGHLAAAESLANLHSATWDGALAGERRLGVLWSTGLQGESACCLVRTGGRP
ncbi:hypothetical protein [Paracidovorax citrulli]